MTSCTEQDINGNIRRTIKCDHGCCGTSSNQQCCDYALSDTVIIVVCVLGALLVIIIAVVLIMCIINSKKQDRVVRIRHPRRGQDHVRRRPEIPKPPPYSELPPEYDLYEDNQTGQSHYLRQSRATRQAHDAGHSHSGVGQSHGGVGQLQQIRQSRNIGMSQQQQIAEETGHLSIYARPQRNNLGAFPPPPTSISSISTVEHRPTQRLIQDTVNEQGKRSASKRKITQIPIPVKTDRRNETPSTSSTRAASTSTAGRSVSTIDSALPGMPVSEEQNLVNNRDQRNATRSAILRRLQAREAELGHVSSDYI